MEKEIWKRIEGGYQVSSLGNVIGKRGKRMVPTGKPNGIAYLAVEVNGRKRTRRVAELVLEAFGHFKTDKNQLPKFKDGDKTNVRLSNLSWSRPTESRPSPYGGNLNKLLNAADKPSTMEFVQPSLTSEAPPHVQSRVMAEYRANQAHLASLNSRQW